MSPSNDNNPLLQGEDQDGVHRQQAEAVHHLLQEEDRHYEEGNSKELVVEIMQNLKRGKKLSNWEC